MNFKKIDVENCLGSRGHTYHEYRLVLLSKFSFCKKFISVDRTMMQILILSITMGATPTMPYDPASLEPSVRDWQPRVRVQLADSPWDTDHMALVESSEDLNRGPVRSVDDEPHLKHGKHDSRAAIDATIRGAWMVAKYGGDPDLCSCLVPSVCQTQTECARLGQDGERNKVISLLASKGVGSVEDLQAMQNFALGNKCRAFMRKEIEAGTDWAHSIVASRATPPLKKLPLKDVGDPDLCSCLVPSIVRTQNECTKLGHEGERNKVLSFLASKGVGSMKGLLGCK